MSEFCIKRIEQSDIERVSIDFANEAWLSAKDETKDATEEGGRKRKRKKGTEIRGWAAQCSLARAPWWWCVCPSVCVWCGVWCVASNVSVSLASGCLGVSEG